MKRRNKNCAYIAAVVLAFTLFIGCIAGMHFAFPVYTEAEIQYLKENGYMHDNVFESIGHDVNNAWLNLQDLMKGGE